MILAGMSWSWQRAIFGGHSQVFEITNISNDN